MTTGEPTASPSDRRRGMPAWLNLLLRVAITAGLLASLRDVKWRDVLHVLADADWKWWLAGLVTHVLVQAVAGVRWAALARPLGFELPRRVFVWRFFEGMFFNLCLPSSIGGDVIKAYRIGDSTPRRLLAGCSVLADRLTGLSALGLPLTLAVAAALLAATLGVFLLAVSCLDKVVAIVPAPHAVRSLLAQLLPYQQRPSVIAKAVAWSFVVQMGGAAAVGLAARAIGVDQPLSLWFSVVPLVALAMVLPISIGGFGVRENALTFLLAEQGVPEERALAVALIWGVSTIVVGLLGGVLVLLDRSRQPVEPQGAEATAG